MHKIPYLFFLTALMVCCSPVSKRSLDRTFRETESRFQDDTGFMLYDPFTKKTIYEFNAAKYFTPASNTKIFTFFASLTILGDSIPALRYESRNDSLIFWGTGDPSFLYRKVNGNDKIFSFLQSVDKNLYFSSANFMTTEFGAGWAWDDYNDDYSAERSPFPMYGNSFLVRSNNGRVVIQPHLAGNYMTVGEYRDKPSVIRNIHSNDFTVFPSAGKSFERDIPLKVSPSLTCQLLSDTLQKEIGYVSLPVSSMARVMYGVPADSVYKVMMQESDNFIAEQLLLMCSGIVSDTLKPEIAIKFMKQGLLKDLVDEPVWVDGSGLSRYNLFTPRSVVQLWEKIYGLVPRDRLFPLLATSGRPGTLRNWFADDTPFIYGKTGTLSNNHCLSGFLVTRTGKTLIFSFMNSNFTTETTNVRRNMQSILKRLYEEY